MPTAKSGHTATEMLEYRCTSRIGTDQRYFVLHPALESARGTFHEVVVVSGYRATYVFAGEYGDVAGYEALIVGPGTDDPDSVLTDLGYLFVDPLVGPVAEAPRAALTVAESRPTRRTVTVVYPLPSGEPVTYLNCEIDEVDNEGDLRIASVGADRSAAGFEYVVWRSGTFSRVETQREFVVDAPAGITDTAAARGEVSNGVRPVRHKAVSGL